MDKKKVLIIGGGASGLMAAARSAKRGLDVTVIEKNPRPARKVMITGKGRCNVTNACFDINDLIGNVPKNPRFLYSAFSAFMPYDTIALFEELGVETKIERGNRVFPVSDKALDIVDALVKYAKSSGAKIINESAKSLIIEDKCIKGVILESGEELFCDSLAICTGGKSYPQTGSTGDGYAFAKAAGHSITPLKPSLVPLVCSNNFIPNLQGLSLKNVSVKLLDGEKTVFSDFGEMLFTHFGISGPLVLSASSHIDNPKNKKYKFIIDLKPALDEKTLDKRIQRDFEENKNKDFINSLSKLLPNKIIPTIVKLSGIEPSVKCNQITREERNNLVYLLKHLTL
ncbi:MAG: aminoacetone oxidase family FAD-binding enzyme, partial [Eubacterium sp.]|nr:aminoacetone oxidase family FAD-binding enzyme [Eubacterium sp.]